MTHLACNSRFAAGDGEGEGPESELAAKVPVASAKGNHDSVGVYRSCSVSDFVLVWWASDFSSLSVASVGKRMAAETLTRI